MTRTVVKFKLEGADNVLDMLKGLPPEIVSKRGGPVRAALRKGAMVIVKQARANFSVAVQQVGKSGITDTTGFTERNIVAKRRQPPPGVNGEKYVVTVNGAKHPNGNLFRNKPIQANDIAFVMEAGSSVQAATPWLRPAFAARAQQAVKTIEIEMQRAIGRAARKAAKTQGL